MGKPKNRLGSERTRSATLAVGYVRRSTDRQEQSIGDQTKAIEAFAAEHGLTLVRFYTDDAISGTSTAKRLGFQQMVADAQAKAPSFRYVVCYDVKRFGRIDNDEAGYYRHLLKQAGVEVLYASEGFAGDSTDDLLRPVKQWQARQESKDLAKVSIRGLVSKATSGASASGEESSTRTGGWWMGGAPPFGYDLRYENRAGEFLFVLRYMRDGSKQMLDERGGPIRTLERGESVSVSKRDRCRLVPSETQRTETVERIFKMYSDEGLGLKAIASRLNASDTPTPRGPDWSPVYSGKWATGTVRAILKNPAYSGDMVWNRRTDARFYRIDGEGNAIERKILGSPRRLEPNDERDWIVNEKAHQSLVSKRTWELTRARFEQRQESSAERSERLAASPPPSGPRSRFLLSGLCRCSLCGSTYEGHRDWTTRNGVKTRSWSYACGGYIRHGRSTCSRGAIPKDKLESIVIDAVLKHYEQFRGPDGRTLLAKAISDLIGGEVEEIEAERRRVERRLSQLDATIRNLIDSLTPANRSLVDRRLGELQDEQSMLAADLARLDARTLSTGEIAKLVRDMSKFIESLPTLLRHGEQPDRRIAIRRCVESATFDRKRGRALMRVRRVPIARGGRTAEGTDEVVAAVPTLKPSARSKQ